MQNMQNCELVVENKKSKLVGVAKLLPDELDGGRKVVKLEIGDSKVELYVKKHAGQGGHDSKHFVLNRYLELDEFFFENLGLWQGEGGKGKGLYFGNTCLELLLHFLRFVEEKIGLQRIEFKVTINTPTSDSEDEIKKRWSEKLKIPFENFTSVCLDQRINYEYAQIYINGIILSELMKNLHEKLKPTILSSKSFSASYMRGIIAAEGQVALKKSGTISHVSIASIDLADIEWYKNCLSSLLIASGKYMENGNKFPIYGRKNLEKVQSLEMLKLHPIKKSKFENGISKFQRFVMKGCEMEKLILQQLNPKPKTYDEIASALNKGRSTIQSHYIPILENKGLVKRVGKRKQAWLFGITQKGLKFLKEK